MNKLVYILLLFSLSGFSQSVKIDGATGKGSDLVTTTSVDSADLLILVQGDTTKSITVYDHHLFVHDEGMCYISTPGQMTIATGGTFEKLFEDNIAYTGEHLHNFTHSEGRLTYTGADNIHITIVCNLSIESDETTQIVQFRIAKNGTTIVGTNMTREFTAVNKDSCIGLNWMDYVLTNDYIEIYGTSDQDGDQFQVNNLTLLIIKH